MFKLKNIPFNAHKNVIKLYLNTFSDPDRDFG